MDAKTVIKAWEIFRDSNPYGICDGREFRAITDPEYCMSTMIEDTIALLKEQEAVEPCNIYSMTLSGKVTPHIFCGKCNKEIYAIYAFCPFCGQAVKWNDDNQRD